MKVKKLRRKKEKLSVHAGVNAKFFYKWTGKWGKLQLHWFFY
jgi:hypothetical protein